MPPRSEQAAEPAPAAGGSTPPPHLLDVDTRPARCWCAPHGRRTAWPRRTDARRQPDTCPQTACAHSASSHSRTSSKRAPRRASRCASRAPRAECVWPLPANCASRTAVATRARFTPRRLSGARKSGRVSSGDHRRQGSEMAGHTSQPDEDERRLAALWAEPGDDSTAKVDDSDDAVTALFSSASRAEPDPETGGQASACWSATRHGRRRGSRKGDRCIGTPGTSRVFACGGALLGACILVVVVSSALTGDDRTGGASERQIRPAEARVTTAPAPGTAPRSRLGQAVRARKNRADHRRKPRPQIPGDRTKKPSRNRDTPDRPRPRAPARHPSPAPQHPLPPPRPQPQAAPVQGPASSACEEFPPC